MPSALAVMARLPVAGAVKTRLGRLIGTEHACTLYAAFLRDIEARFAAGPRVLVWAFHPPESDFASFVAPGAICLPQAGADLGERLHNCFRSLCARGFDRIITIGGDAPHLRDEWLDEAESALQAHD